MTVCVFSYFNLAETATVSMFSVLVTPHSNSVDIQEHACLCLPVCKMFKNCLLLPMFSTHFKQMWASDPLTLLLLVSNSVFFFTLLSSKETVACGRARSRMLPCKKQCASKADMSWLTCGTKINLKYSLCSHCEWGRGVWRLKTTATY